MLLVLFAILFLFILILFGKVREGLTPKDLFDIQEIINKAIDDHEPEDTSAGELEDYVSMSNFATIDNNKIKFNYDYRKTVYN